MLAFPSVEGVRLATFEDLYRVSIVAAAAFFWSPTFRFQRPRYKDFPSDTIASYLVEYEAALKDPSCVVLVAEDVIEESEAEHVYEALRFAYGTDPPRQRGIVGVCSISLKPASSFVGHFQAPIKQVGATGSLDLSTQPEACDSKRDQCDAALEVYETITRPAKLKHLAGKMRLNTLAVAPSYWRRGHASRLLSFCTQLADLDDAPLGVSATPSGAIVARKAGFKECEVIHIKRLVAHEKRACEDPPNAADVSLWIGVRSSASPLVAS